MKGERKRDHITILAGYSFIAMITAASIVLIIWGLLSIQPATDSRALLAGVGNSMVVPPQGMRHAYGTWVSGPGGSSQWVFVGSDACRLDDRTEWHKAYNDLPVGPGGVIQVKLLCNQTQTGVPLALGYEGIHDTRDWRLVIDSQQQGVSPEFTTRTISYKEDGTEIPVTLMIFEVYDGGIFDNDHRINGEISIVAGVISGQ